MVHILAILFKWVDGEANAPPPPPKRRCLIICRLLSFPRSLSPFSAVIKMEGGTDRDLLALDQKQAEQWEGGEEGEGEGGDKEKEQKAKGEDVYMYLKKVVCSN